MFGEDRGVLLFEKREVLGIRNRAVLHRFGKSRRELNAGERAEQLRIGYDDTRGWTTAVAPEDVHRILSAG